jgi:predicted nucleic acid-binding Zn ribbon protein
MGMAYRSSLMPLPEILTPLLKTHGLHSHLLEFSLQQHWPEIVGDQVGRHTWPEALRHRQLYLLAENSVWLQQLRFLKPELLAKVTAYAGSDAITDIVLRVGTLPSPETDERPSPRPPEEDSPSEWRREVVDEEARATIDASIQPVTDPELRERLRLLLTKSAVEVPKTG